MKVKMKIIKRILCCLIIICILLFIANTTVFTNYIVFEYMNTYLCCAITILVYSLICLKLINIKKKAISITVIVILMLIAFSSCYMFVEISHLLHRNSQYYDIKIDNLSNDYDIVLYEFGAFRGKSGCLCIKINEYVHKKIENTKYTVATGITLSDPNNLILSYNAETNELIMKYKSSPNSDYTEQIAIID